jgi:hypothetical protein
MAAGEHKYIPRGGEVAWIGPCGFTNATLYGFVIEADPTLVHEMLSRYIGEPSQDLGAHIDVRGTTLDRVLFVFLDSDRHQVAISPGGGSAGTFNEQLFAIVVLGCRLGPDPGLVMFAPYIYTSETPGWKADREIYGFPLQHGYVSIKKDGGHLPAALSVEAPVIERFGKTATAKKTAFVSVSRTRRQSQQAGQSAAVLRAMSVEPIGRPAAAIVPQPRAGVTRADLAFFERFGRSPSPSAPDRSVVRPLNLADELLSGRLRMLFLKQFRDIVFPDRACYQAIVEAPFEVDGDIAVSGDEYVLELKDVDSVPIRRELGIPAGDVPVDLAFRMDLKQLSIGEAQVVSNPDWNTAIEIGTADEPSRLPRYVERGGEAVWRQPSRLLGARIYGFGLPVSAALQEATLQRLINDVAAAGDSTYGSRPFALHPCAGLDMMMLMFVEYTRIASGNAQDAKLGGSSYREFVAMQLAISDDPEFPELDWFIPYICLDADAPRLGGREIYGYPKQLGTIPPFTPYDGHQTPRELVVTTTVIRDPAKSASQRGDVVRVVGPAAPPAERNFSTARELIADVAAVGGASLMRRIFPFVPPGGAGQQADLEGLGPGVEILAALLNTSIGDVFLKEFRDCVDPRLPCCQTICKTDTIPVKFNGGATVDPSGYRITISDFASEPLLSGVLGGGRGGRTPSFAYWVDVDLELTVGRVIANPLAADYPHAPDTSLKRTPPEPGSERLKRRVARFTEPFWMK